MGDKIRIEPAEREIPPEKLVELLHDYEPLSCDPQPMDVRELSEILIGHWRPFRIQGVRR